jgi:hypothetical protein
MLAAIARRGMFVALTLGSLLAACSKQQGQVHDAQAESASAVTNRLQGAWVLVSFQPEVPLEPALQLLLNDQMQHFVVEFQGASLSARGPSVTIARTYRVYDAYENHFKATVTDQYGIAVESSCDFVGDTLVANGWTPPWRGKAVFRRP